ncbi:hypothetical protein MLD38_009770 [Melastoma candidum]|uniref:Uncharacterized protein n=1 Tax=Melastoma candidum TaxID=119954 RepID=A0ACB9RYJ7_9MYRT|nr:hypothetical protein MLD38_009770 [Melastoma candidum]
MGGPSPLLDELRRLASSFINSARLKLTDVTEAQLLAEEVTDGNLWPPDTRTMALISRAAFEVDDYWRIVDVVHKRLRQFDRRNWRSSYKALILLEHLVTRGPKSVVDEFDCDVDVIMQMGNFQYVDEKGFDWGSRVHKLAERMTRLLDKDQGLFLEQERARARVLARGIQGHGSFDQRRPISRPGVDSGIYISSTTMFGRCNSEHNGSNRDGELDNRHLTEDDHPFNKKGYDRSAIHLISEGSTKFAQRN